MRAPAAIPDRPAGQFKIDPSASNIITDRLIDRLAKGKEQ
jgi:hypothetical protein